MALDRENVLLDVTGSYINRKFNEQTWFQENANFVTTFGGFLATVVAWAATQPFATSPGWQMVILIAGFLLTALGVKSTKNGFSKSQVEKINRAQAEYIGTTPLVPDKDPDLDAMVESYNAERE